MNDSIKLAIEQLYLVFNVYKIEDPAKVSCFDYGPDVEELASISKNLRDIPADIMGRMAFYEKGWDSWGTKNEVKYFLPRLLECLAEDIELLDNPSCFSLFKYKLLNCLSSKNKDWSVEEKEPLQNFFEVLLEYHFSRTHKLGYLVEGVLAMDMAPDKILANWDSSAALHKNQVISLFEHFSCLEYLRPSVPKGVYIEDRERVKKFIALLYYTKLTPEELDEIS